MITVVSDENIYLQSLNVKSRDKKIKNNNLASLHILIGEALGRAMLDFRPLYANSFETVQGVQCTAEKVNKSNITIVVLMRAGLYVGQGVRNILDSEDQIFILSNNVEDVDLGYIDGRDVIVIDSVINTGETIVKYIDRFQSAKSVSCISMVMQSCFKKIASQYPYVLFLTSRVSENYYIGKGATDTGNRLFGTIK